MGTYIYACMDCGDTSTFDEYIGDEFEQYCCEHTKSIYSNDLPAVLDELEARIDRIQEGKDALELLMEELKENEE